MRAVVLLSGGLDSSSVVCMADLLVKQGRVDAAAIQPISHVPASSPEGDERRFIAAVEDRIGTKSRILVLDDQDLDDSHADWATPFAARGVALALVQYVRDQGGRVVLSGRVGDAVMGCVVDNSVAVLDSPADRRSLEAGAGGCGGSTRTTVTFTGRNGAARMENGTSAGRNVSIDSRIAANGSTGESEATPSW